MPLSILWGMLVFKTTPDLQSFIGMGMIVASGLYIIWRETIRSQKAPKSLGRGAALRALSLGVGVVTLKKIQFGFKTHLISLCQ